jgi:hypothetical protein
VHDIENFRQESIWQADVKIWVNTCRPLPTRCTVDTMAAADDHPRSGLSRRDALKLLAASSTTVAAGSMIVSQPAHADNGSAPCRYDFSQTPTVTVRITNQAGNRRDSLSITVSGVGGECPCGNRTAPIEYAYWITIPGTGSGGIGWITSNAVSVGNPTTLWSNSGGAVTVAVGIRVTCPAAGGGTATRCLFGSATYTVVGPNSNTAPTLTLADGGSPPAGIPACESPLQRSAPLLRSSSSNGLVVVAGAGSPPAYDPTAGDPSTGLGTPPADTTTTTTDKPGNGPKKPVESTTTTTTPVAPTDTSTSTTTTEPTG